jgi:hypothetical protein
MLLNAGAYTNLQDRSGDTNLIYACEFQCCQMVCFHTKKLILQGLGTENVGTFMVIWIILWSFGIFYCHLDYVTVIWIMLLSFGKFYGRLVYFSPFWFV